MNRDTLLLLSKDDLIGLILAQHGQIEALSARITKLEARLGTPPKTPDNSSLPPSKGQKPNLPDRPKHPRRGRPGVSRALAERPDRILSRQHSPPVRTVPMRSALPTRLPRAQGVAGPAAGPCPRRQEDDAAECDALDSGRLRGAVLGVFEPEPVPVDHRLWTTRNLTMTPHVSSDDPVTYNADSLDIFFDNLRAFAAGKALLNRFDTKRGY